MKNRARAGLGGWLLRYYGFAALVLVAAVFVVGVRTYRALLVDIPDLDHIESYSTTAPGVTRIVAADGALLAELAREHRAYVRYEDIPAVVVESFLAAEDRRFFTHDGLDYRGLARATLANFRSGELVQGGSTITQQVAKGFLTHDRTLGRKVREAILSLRLEARLPKARILEVYLNKIFLGSAAYGVASAASRYFDKSLSELTLAEAALIAGMARAPSRYSPFSSLERATRRRAVVLQDMVEAGYITPEQRDEADREPIVLARPTDVFRERAPYYAEHVRKALSERLGPEVLLQEGLTIETPARLDYQAFAEHAIDRAVRKLDRRQGWRGPVAHLDDPAAHEELHRRLLAHYDQALMATDPDRFQLALVVDVQRWTVEVDLGRARARLPLKNMHWASRYDRNTGVNDVTVSDARDALEVGDVIWVRSDDGKTDTDSGLAVVELGQTPRVEGALYTIDLVTESIVTMQGGHDYDASQFNRTTQACRQPGSVFKAIYYAHAIDRGDFDMGTVLDDKPYEPEAGEEWNPQNLHGTVDGKVLLRTAFVRSLNLASIKLFMRLGAQPVVDFARKLGFSTELIADKALSLGASCVRIDELARAFSIFAAGGRSVAPRYLRRVVDKRGRTLIDERNAHDGAMDVAGRIDRMAAAIHEPPRQVVDARTAFVADRLMRDAVTHGIASRAMRIGVEAAGKSGTASKAEYTTDTWFVGFTSRYVTASWMGDDTYERSMGDMDASFTTATPMWTEYMTKVVEGVPHDDVPNFRPPGIRSQVVDAASGGEPIVGMPQAVLYFRE